MGSSPSRENNLSNSALNSPSNVNIHDKNPIDEVTVLEGHKDRVRLLVKINEYTIASCSDDFTAIIWNINTGQKVFTLEGHTLPITCMMIVNFSPLPDEEGEVIEYLVTGSNDKTVRVWDVNTGELLHILMGHTSSITCLEKITDKYFCSGANDDSQLIIWNIFTGEMKKSITRVEDRNLNQIISIESHRLLITASDSLVAYKNLEFFEHLPPVHRESIKSLVAINQNQFVSGSLDGSVVLWSAITLKTLKVLFSNDRVVSHNQYGLKVAKIVPLSRSYIAVALGCGFKVFHIDSGNCIIDFRNAHQSEITSIVPLFSGEMFVTSSIDNSIRLWGDFVPPVFHRSASPSSHLKTNSDISELANIVEQKEGVIVQDNHSHSLPQIPNLKEKINIKQPALRKSSGSEKSSPRSRSLSRPRRLLKYDKRITCRESLHCFGEMMFHSGGVVDLLKVTEFGFASCSTDSFVIVWRDGRIQKEIRNHIASGVILEDRRKRGLEDLENDVDSDDYEEVTIIQDYSHSERLIYSSVETSKIVIGRRSSGNERKRSVSSNWNGNRTPTRESIRENTADLFAKF